jgi:hypothetical protein
MLYITNIITEIKSIGRYPIIKMNIFICSGSFDVSKNGANPKCITFNGVGNDINALYSVSACVYGLILRVSNI